MDEKHIAGALCSRIGDRCYIHIDQSIIVDIADIDSHAIGGFNASCLIGIVCECAVLVVGVELACSCVCDENEFGIVIAVHVSKLWEKSVDPGAF